MRTHDEKCPRCRSPMNRDEPCGMCDYTFPVEEENESAEGTETDSLEWDDNIIIGNPPPDFIDPESDCPGGEG